MPRHKRLADCRTAEGLSRESSIHSNLLPLLFGMLPASRRSPVLEFVKSRLADIFHPESRKRRWAQRVSPYFMHYVLAALYAGDEDRFALDQIRQKYGWMIDQATNALWENFIERGSLCHAWSASPTHYLSTKVLGVEFLTPGQLRRLTLWPRVGDLQFARGVYPHPDGPIHVAWHRDSGGLFELEARLPLPMRVDLCLPAYLVDEPRIIVNGEEAWQHGAPHKQPAIHSERQWVQLAISRAQEVYVRIESTR
jgi:hypothetical protein